MVVFVDAAVDAPREVQWRKLGPDGSSQLMAHAADPRTLLALARDVFGRCPEAWWLTIPAVNLEFGEELSAETRAGLNVAFQRIRSLAGKCQRRMARNTQRRPMGVEHRAWPQITI